MAASGGGGGKKDGSATSIVADQISQSVQSTSNLLHLMLHSSPSRDQLMKLPRNLLAMTSTIRNTESVLEQMPRVISSLDTHVERGLQWSWLAYLECSHTDNLKRQVSLHSSIEPSLPHLDTVVQLLSNMPNNQLKSLSGEGSADLTQQDLEPSEQDSRVT